MIKKGKLIRFGKHCAVVAFAFMAMGLLATLAINMSFLSPVAHAMEDFTLTDVYYHVLQEYGKPDTSRVVTIVDMAELRNRKQIADVLDSITKCKPKVTGVDIVFEGESDDPEADIRIMEAASNATNAVFSYRMYDYVDETVGYVSDAHSFFSDVVNIEEGFTNFERTLYGGMKRTVSLQRICKGEKQYSLVEKVAQRYADRHLIINDSNDVAVNFKPTKFRIIKHDEIAENKDLIEGNVCLFGAVNELSDMHYTPLGEMSGVELLAYSVQTLLEQKEVKHLPAFVTWILSFIIVLLTYLGRLKYMEWAKSRQNEWAKFFLTSTFVIGLLVFAWTTLLVWIGFIVFTLTSVSLNLGWAMAAIPFLGGAGEFYGLTLSRFFRR